MSTTCHHPVSDITWHAPGLAAKVDECDRILAIHDTPDGNTDVIATYTAAREDTVRKLSEVVDA